MNETVTTQPKTEENPPLQPTPDDLIQRLMNKIRTQFCANLDDKAWFKVHYHFIKRNVVMWPAREVCCKHGFTLHAERYEKIMVNILDEIKQNQKEKSIKFWPGYLMKCVQSHWQHHWEEYYAEAKSVRNLAERALFILGGVRKREDRTVEALASAHRILTSHKRSQKKSNPATQLSFLENLEH